MKVNMVTVNINLIEIVMPWGNTVGQKRRAAIRMACGVTVLAKDEGYFEFLSRMASIQTGKINTHIDIQIEEKDDFKL